MAIPESGPGAPSPGIALADPGGARARIEARRVEPDAALLARLADACAEVVTEAAAVGEASRDWWPLAAYWAAEAALPARAAAVARPGSAAEVAAVVALCNEAEVPLTVAAGRSGVCGSSLPLHGGVVLDVCGLAGIVELDDASLLVSVRPGTFGDRFEDALQREHGLTCGHWPQSLALSTVGGWIACRGAGQLSTRYGKIEDMVVGLEVVLADGRTIHTGGHPRAAVGPDLTQLFVGSEGTLGVVTEALLRVHPRPLHERRAAFGFDSFGAGLDACRRILRRGATPAVLRLYDERESVRHGGPEGRHLLLVLDEGEPALLDAGLGIVEAECSAAERLDEALVGRWLEHRFQVVPFEKLFARGLIADTMEISASWAALPALYERTLEAIRAVPGTIAVSAHQSHAYTDGACLYFSFAGRPEPAERDAWYRAAWDAGTRAVLGAGGSLSHHHGVGLNRARFMAEALGPAHDVLVALKQALDPRGILNPGKLGLPSPFGPVPWP
jgi:alkyldihydroxyacetonephosphate synthase